MIYDLLHAYKDYLLTFYRPDTAETYYKKICTLFEGQSLVDTIKRLDVDMVMGKLSEVKHKNRFSQYKNAFMHFCAFQGINLAYDTLKHIKELETGTRKKRRKLGAVDFTEVDKKIKRIRNKRLKISYQAIIATGLRVSEIADISPMGCIVTDKEITFNFTAKGGVNAVATITKASYPKLYKDIGVFIESDSNAQDKSLFYSADYLQKKARELGFTCHDLRRAFAKLEYKKCRSKTAVMKKLRHTSKRTTNIYLRSKVKID